MDADRYHGELAAVLAWCCDQAVLQRYIERGAADLAALVEPGLCRHLRRLQQSAKALVQVGSVEALAEPERPYVDALFTDLLAVATYEDWEGVPLESAGRGPLALEVERQGLLGLDPGIEGAILYVVGPDSLAIVRNRKVSDQADASRFQHG